MNDQRPEKYIGELENEYSNSCTCRGYPCGTLFTLFGSLILFSLIIIGFGWSIIMPVFTVYIITIILLATFKPQCFKA